MAFIPMLNAGEGNLQITATTDNSGGAAKTKSYNITDCEVGDLVYVIGGGYHMTVTGSITNCTQLVNTVINHSDYSYTRFIVGKVTVAGTCKATITANRSDEVIRAIYGKIYNE